MSGDGLSVVTCDHNYITIYGSSLVPRRGGGGGESAWYTLFTMLTM